MPEASLIRLKSLLKIAKEYGLKNLSVGNITFEFAPYQISSGSLEDSTTTFPLNERMPSDDEMLFYSADSPIQVPKI